MDQLDKVVMGGNTVPGGNEPLSQLSLVSRMPLKYLQGYFGSDIFNQIQIRGLSRPV